MQFDDKKLCSIPEQGPSRRTLFWSMTSTMAAILPSWGPSWSTVIRPISTNRLNGWKGGKKIVKTRKANKFIKILFVKVSRIKSKRRERSWQIKSRKVTFLHLSMDFVRSNFGANEPLPVEHFFPHFLAGCCVCAKWGKKFISTELTSYQPLFFVRLPSCRQSKGSGICSCKKPMLFTKIVDF